MGKLSNVSPREFERFLKFVGCTFVRQKGSHKVYFRPGMLRPVIIPIHSGDLPIFVVRNNLRLLNISVEDYLDVLSRL